MTFTMSTSGAALPPGRKLKAPLAPLGKVWKDWTVPGCWEPVKAVTTDGEWLFERAEDGTWNTGHLPTETEVKAGRRTLRACRAYVASGAAQGDLNRIQTEGKENGNG